MVLCGDEQSLRKASLGQHINSFQITNENLVAVNKKPAMIELKKPLAVGFSILELSKLFMYRSYYDTIQQHFGEENVSLCFSDTDSFLLKVRCNNLEREMKKLEHMFDFSKYPKQHPLFDDSRANKLFYFKDKLKGRAAIAHFIGLRPKCYSMKIVDFLDKNKTEEMKICKGLKKSSIKKQLTYDDYKKCLKQSVVIYKSFKNLRSKNHKIRTCFQRKIALSAMDSKRHILNCGYHTLLLGNCLIVNNKSSKCHICK